MKFIFGFADSTRNLALPEEVVREALMLLQDNEEITFLASVKQETGDSGSIISFSSGLYRYMALFILFLFTMTIVRRPYNLFILAVHLFVYQMLPQFSKKKKEKNKLQL